LDIIRIRIISVNPIKKCTVSGQSLVNC